ncbi:MAG: hypothetical protein K2H38_08440, partial [Muribaculaceae bacterium]|nr:hypothetical protein [Muribaculaceae bacterium]
NRICFKIRTKAQMDLSIPQSALSECIPEMPLKPIHSKFYLPLINKFTNFYLLPINKIHGFYLSAIKKALQNVYLTNKIYIFVP